jgi:3-dehydrosphinganine reductase
LSEFRICYVTGGSSGIGFAVATELVRMGANVAVIARDRSRLDAAAAHLQSLRLSEGQRVVAAVCDVADAAAVSRVFDGLVRDLGAPDLLVNNAGFAYFDYFESLTEAHLRDLTATNLFGCFHTVHAVLPHMKAKGGGTIVNVASVGGLVGYFGATAYCATKFGVIGFSEALRNELAPWKIRVVVLCPPNTATPGLDRENINKPAETHAVEGTAGTYSPEQVARSLIRGLRGNSYLVFCGFMSRLTAFVNRIAPRLVHAAMDSDVAKARKRIAKETPR